MRAIYVTKKRRRAAIYARYSSDRQREESIEDQTRICRQAAESEDLIVVEVFSDSALRGYDHTRPGLNALLDAVRRGEVDVVIVEAVDRIARRGSLGARFWEVLAFYGVQLIATSDGGLVDPLSYGIRSVVAEEQSRNQAAKTRRGLQGRVLAGRSAGGLSYGYRIVRGQADARGEFERGLREIDPEQAKIVLRIFEEFASGKGPKAIAKSLNEEGIPGPRNGYWTPGTIRGQAKRGTGILRNRLYIGVIVWNQREWRYSPETARRVARQNEHEEITEQEVPELRIIPQELWDRVQRRLEAQRADAAPDEEAGSEARNRFWEQKRPQHLLTGKVVCGSCGATFASVGRNYLACRVATNNGDCTNRSSVQRPRLEAEVLASLETELMAPDLVAAFVAEFAAAWNERAREAGSGAATRRRELGAIERKLQNIVRAIEDGLHSPIIQQQLHTLETQRARLEHELAAAELNASVPRIHPNVSEVYRQRVGDLRAQLADKTRATTVEAMEALRGLVERVEVHPGSEPGGRHRIELIGHLTAMLRAGGAELPSEAKNPSSAGSEGLVDEW